MIEEATTTPSTRNAGKRSATPEVIGPLDGATPENASHADGAECIDVQANDVEQGIVTGFELTSLPNVVRLSEMSDELTVRQAADRLGVSTSRVRQLVLAGELKARHLNPRMLMVDAKSVNRFKRPQMGRPPKTGKKAKP